MAALARVLEDAGYGTFLPQRDGLEAYVLRFVDSPLHLGPLRARVDAAIFALDVYQIVERCAGLVLNLNGRVPDEGGVAEAATAHAVGRPVVLYKNDRRTAFGGRDNPMVTSLSPLPPVRDLGRLAAALRRVLGRADGEPPPAPGRLGEAVRLGHRIWQVLERAPGGLGKEHSGRALVAEIATLCAAVTPRGRSARTR